MLNKKLSSNLLHFFVLTIFIVGVSVFLFSIHYVYSASLYFSPSTGEHAVGDILSTDVRVNTQGEVINNVGGTISFPTDLLEVVSVSKSGTIFPLWVENPSFNNTTGKISFDGGVPTPGFNGISGKIMNIVFRIKSSGSASLFFSSASVLANDGLGTDILQNKISAQFSLVSKNNNIQRVATTSAVPGTPKIISITHPDSANWYNKNTANFKWVVPDDVTAVRLLYGENQFSNPSVLYEPAISKKVINNLKDGVYYFHAQFKNKNGWGKISHFKFNVDVTPPEEFNVSVDNGGDETDPTPILNFGTTDEMSGIDHYEIKIGNGEPMFINDADIVNGFKLPKQIFGDHDVVVKAFDRAGNYTTSYKKISVSPINSPTVDYYPKEITVGEEFIISGSSIYNGDTIRLFIEHENDGIVIKNTKIDPDGRWVYVANEPIKSGVYKTSVQVVDSRGAVSKVIGGFVTIVKNLKWIKAGKTAINYLSTIIPLIALVLVMVIIVLYGWRKIISSKRKIYSEARLAEKYSSKAFDILKKEIKKQVDRIKNRQIISKEDKEIVDNLSKAVEESERLIAKNEKELKKIKKEER